jgi:di/tricarboxylate transporter
MEINALEGVAISPDAKLGLELVSTREAVLVECVVGPHFSLIGRSIREMNFRRRYGVLVLAMHRKGVSLRDNFTNVRLEYGDTLLVQGPESAIRELRDGHDFLLLIDVPHTPKRRRKQWIAVGAVVMVVGLAATNVMPIAALAMLAVVGVVVTGCLKMNEVYEAVDWKIIFLIVGMLSLGLALEKTKGAEWLAHGAIGGMGLWGPVVVLSVVYLIASVLTEFLTNNAVAVLLTPIAIQIAAGMQVSPRPFLIAVAIGASASFATPIGYQTNTLVYGAGGYRFGDFLKIGLPLNVLLWILATILIPILWPFTS